ncbi:hypothetical protein ANCDUO_25928, partial [Ancylostoma duodenale]
LRPVDMYSVELYGNRCINLENPIHSDGEQHQRLYAVRCEVSTGTQGELRRHIRSRGLGVKSLPTFQIYREFFSNRGEPKTIYAFVSAKDGLNLLKTAHLNETVQV